jgi:hypothetical protein
VSDAPLRLRPAVPADLPQLEAWCATLRPDERPPFIAATLAEFEQSPGRGTLLIVEDSGHEAGFVVLARLWSNRTRGEIAVLDDVLVEASIDAELLRHEVESYAKRLGIDQVTYSASLM